MYLKSLFHFATKYYTFTLQDCLKHSRLVTRLLKHLIRTIHVQNTGPLILSQNGFGFLIMLQFDFVFMLLLFQLQAICQHCAKRYCTSWYRTSAQLYLRYITQRHSYLEKSLLLNYLEKTNRLNDLPKIFHTVTERQ